jgi:hypothetical protein
LQQSFRLKPSNLRRWFRLFSITVALVMAASKGYFFEVLAVVPWLFVLWTLPDTEIRSLRLRDREISINRGSWHRLYGCQLGVAWVRLHRWHRNHVILPDQLRSADWCRLRRSLNVHFF